MRRSALSRRLVVGTSVAAFVVAALGSHLAARAQLPGARLPGALPIPPAALRPALPLVSIGSATVLGGRSLALTTTNVGAPAAGRIVKMSRVLDGRTVTLAVSTWGASQIVVSIPANPFGDSRDAEVELGIADSSGAWVAPHVRTWFRWRVAVEVRHPPCDPPNDDDADGHTSQACGGDDCDDADGNRYPGNGEVCDPGNHDEDCDIDTFGIRDQDRDGAPDQGCCNRDASGHQVCGSDCNDVRDDIHPGLVEACDGVDNDCDGTNDEGALRTLWRDGDGDGFGNPSARVQACDWSTGLSWVPNDCDDTRRDVFMGHGCS